MQLGSLDVAAGATISIHTMTTVSTATATATAGQAPIKGQRTRYESPVDWTTLHIGFHCAHQTARMSKAEPVDYYKTLGIPRDATDDDIKKAYVVVAL